MHAYAHPTGQFKVASNNLGKHSLHCIFSRNLPIPKLTTQVETGYVNGHTFTNENFFIIMTFEIATKRVIV